MKEPTFIKQALNHQPLTVYGDGLQTRSFSDVQRLESQLWHLLLSSPNSKGEIVNVGNDKVMLDFRSC